MTDLLLLLGSFSIFLAAVGLWRMPDTLSKLHAATKASAFGIVLFAIATSIEDPTVWTISLCAAIVGILYITAPLACHAISSKELSKMGEQDEEEG